MDETSRKLIDRLLEAEEARAIDIVLEAATKPELPAGAEERLLTRLEREDRVVTLPSRRTSPGQMLRWTTALPLAASLALGIYLGAMGTLDGFLPETVTGELAASDEENADLSGVSEAESYVEGDVS
jgi:hypothetical protein